MKIFFLKIYRFIFCRKLFYGINLNVYKLALRGIGVLNSGELKVTGEKYLLEVIIPKLKIKTVFDIGANDGGYSLILKKSLPSTSIYAFEPHPETFIKLQGNTRKTGIRVFNVGFGNKEGTKMLYDFAEDAELKYTQPTSTLASLNKYVIESLHGQKSKSYKVKLATIDSFCKKNKIKSIDFLKIDTEGSEYQVLKGATNLLKKNKIEIILFEFNEMNVYSRIFFKDFIDILPNYNIYRLMPDGLLSISDYQPKLHEIFAYQNIVAIEKNISLG